VVARFRKYNKTLQKYVLIDTIAAQMSELRATLEDLGLQECLNDLVEHGLHGTRLPLSETDMETLGI
jgi:hypothetical protein